MRMVCVALLCTSVVSAEEMRPARGQWANRGGTVIQCAGPRTWVITTNGPLPVRGVVSVQRNGQVIDGGHVAVAGQSVAQIRTWSSVVLQPGDLVLLDAVPAPLGPAPVFGNVSAGGRYHPSSTNADPRYQSWLRQGFTLGNSCSHGFSSGFYSGRCR
jgi:hypothetical protein